MWPALLIALAQDPANPARPATPPPIPAPATPTAPPPTAPSTPPATPPASSSTDPATPPAPTASSTEPATPSSSTEPATPPASSTEPAATPPPSTTRPATAPSPDTAPPARERVRLRLDDMSTFGVGLAVGARLDSRRFGDPQQGAASHGRVDERSGVGELHLRLVGYAEAPSRSKRFLWFVLPDVHVGFMFGGTVARRDAAAAANDHPIRRRGGFAGLLGHVGAGAGLASPGRVGAYGKGVLAMSGLIGGSTEGAYGSLRLGLGAGLRLAPRPDLTILLGPRLDGVLGVHGIAGPRPVLQLAPGGDFAIHARIGYRAYLALGGALDVTAAGRSFGGQRLQGRGTLDLAFPLKGDMRLTFFLMYMGLHVTAPPAAPRFPPEGMTLNHQVMLLGVGLGT